MTVLIAGAGIGGLTTALMLHRRGIDAAVYEAAPVVREVGVGINVLPHAIRELKDLGLLPALDAVGIRTRELRYLTRDGQEVWREARGMEAGHDTPQFSIHRGRLQSVLHKAVLERLGAGAIRTGRRLAGFMQDEAGITAHFSDSAEGRAAETVRGCVLVCADGIHSVGRRFFYPGEGSPEWNGVVMWRGATQRPVWQDGRSMAIAGGFAAKLVLYPIAEPQDGMQLLNWVVNVRVKDPEASPPPPDSWSRAASHATVLPFARRFTVPGIDIPALVRATDTIFEYPMADRAPLPRWSFGFATLLGDAAHPMYPVGSNGASQAILDARCLADCLHLAEHPRAALRAYEKTRLPVTAEVVALNRKGGPERVIDEVERLAPAGFGDINDVLSEAERKALVSGYAKTAGGPCGGQRLCRAKSQVSFRLKSYAPGPTAEVSVMSHTPATPILSVRNLTTSFVRDGRRTAVVRDISFDLAQGETVAVVGESGSGKSVTALSVMRLITAPGAGIEGSVRLDGRELLTLPEPEMRLVRGSEIAMVFQEPMTSLNPLLTIGHQLSESLMILRGLSRNEARAEAIRLLERVRIPDARARFDVYPHSLSGGMRQRVMIAMALSCKPRVLVADEPTTALDVTIQAQILDLIKELQDEEKMAVLFITHDMGVVAEISDRAVVMYNGEVVETGRTEDIFAAPARPYTKALLSAVPRLGSMQGQARPMPFPTMDRTTGAPDAPIALPDKAPGDAVVLEVKNLTKRFDVRSGLLSRVRKRVHAVEDVSFSIKAGETLSLVGESGSGKSTIGRSILGLTEAQSGQILLGGQDLLKLGREQMRAARQDLQIIFQDPYSSLNPRLSVGEAIVEPIVVQGLADRAQARVMTAELLRRVGLSEEMAARYPHEFSGGQRQRICIARALALRPKLIVADEAVSALDVSIKAQVINLMLELQNSLGLSYLFISHDMAVVERVSHHVAVLYLGEIVEIGPRQAIFDSPQHPYTKKLMSAVPVPDPHRRGRRKIPWDDDIKSVTRRLDYVPAKARYIQAGDGHLVREA